MKTGIRDHPPISEAELVKKRDIFDPLEDDENSRSSRERRRYTDQTERLEQQLEDLRLEYEAASTELQRLQRQQGEVVQREGVIAKLTDQVEKMRGDSINQRTSLRKEMHELRATLEDRDLRLEEL